MRDGITWVALDTAKKGHVGAVLDPGAEKAREVSVRNEVGAIRRLARKLVREASGEVRVCYEAGPCGYALKRELERSAALTCAVVAPALIPIRPGARVKTDRRDARKLVMLFRSGELTEVHAPTEAHEAVRDLVRCREDAKQDQMRGRHRLGKFLLRRGHVYLGGRAWTQRHENWISAIVWEHEADRLTVESYRLSLSQLSDRLQSLDERIEAISQTEPYGEAVGWLRCFRGIDTVTAMTIVAELHDFRRFRNARALMNYLGMTPSEHSSGDRVRRGGITKTGNCHVRRVLIESAWCLRHRPAVGYNLRRRRAGQPDWVIAHADRAMHRLWCRYQRLLGRGKSYNKVVAAIARELVGFLWAVLTEGQRRREAVQAQARCHTQCSRHSIATI